MSLHAPAVHGLGPLGCRRCPWPRYQSPKKSAFIPDAIARHRDAPDQSQFTSERWCQSVAQPEPQLPPTVWTAVMVLQAAALVGAFVTGLLARKRREQIDGINEKLRQINSEMRRQREEAAAASGAEVPGALQYRTALERSLEAPSAAHPTESFGNLKLSLARARRQIGACIKQVKEELQAGRGASCFRLLDEASQTAADIKDGRAERAISRLRAKALRQTGDLPAALGELRRSMELSAELGDGGADADTLGEMGDVLTEMKDYEQAGRYYDRCIQAIQEETPRGASSTWDAA